MYIFRNVTVLRNILIGALGAKLYTLKDENLKKCIRMGIIVLKIVMLGGKGELCGLKLSYHRNSPV